MLVRALPSPAAVDVNQSDAQVLTALLEAVAAYLCDPNRGPDDLAVLARVAPLRARCGDPDLAVAAANGLDAWTRAAAAWAAITTGGQLLSQRQMEWVDRARSLVRRARTTGPDSAGLRAWEAALAAWADHLHDEGTTLVCCAERGLIGAQQTAGLVLVLLTVLDQLAAAVELDLVVVTHGPPGGHFRGSSDSTENDASWVAADLLRAAVGTQG